MTSDGVGSSTSAISLDGRAVSSGLRQGQFTNRRLIMARKPATRAEFTLFDVFYEDGSRNSNRKVQSKTLGGIDGDAPARVFIEEQDRLIAEKRGIPPMPITSIRRSGDK